MKLNEPETQMLERQLDILAVDKASTAICAGPACWGFPQEHRQSSLFVLRTMSIFDSPRMIVVFTLCWLSTIWFNIAKHPSTVIWQEGGNAAQGTQSFVRPWRETAVTVLFVRRPSIWFQNLILWTRHCAKVGGIFKHGRVFSPRCVCLSSSHRRVHGWAVWKVWKQAKALCRVGCEIRQASRNSFKISAGRSCMIRSIVSDGRNKLKGSRLTNRT